VTIKPKERDLFQTGVDVSQGDRLTVRQDEVPVYRVGLQEHVLAGDAPEAVQGQQGIPQVIEHAEKQDHVERTEGSGEISYTVLWTYSTRLFKRLFTTADPYRSGG
jgi:hypothetical protein